MHIAVAVMPTSRKSSRKCIFFLALSVIVTMLLLPAEIFEYHSYLRHIMSQDSEYLAPQFNWTLGRAKENSENVKNENIPEVKEEKIDGKSNEIKKVIILAYMRSGSSLTGKLLEQSDNSIYFFEPLRPLEWSYSRKLPLIDFNNKTRMSDSKDEDKEYWIKIIEDLLSCKFRSTYKNIFFDRSRSSDDRFKPFYNCVGTEIHNVDKCLHIIQDLCDQSLVRIAKVIRMSADSAFEMLERSSDLKVIHLLRDPRAIINSLQDMRMKFDVKGKAEVLCDYIKENIILFEEIFNLYPKQTATLYFESIAQDPIAMTKKLYDFIGVPTTDSVISWVKENMLGKSLDNATYSVKNRNSRDVSNKWRYHIKFEDISNIDSACEDLYSISGYLKVMDRKLLNDTKIINFINNSTVVRSDLEHRREKSNSLNKN